MKISSLFRRLQNWGGLPSLKGMIQEAIPEWLSEYCNKIAKLGIFEDNVPNHILINEYLPKQGIMPHVDGPTYYPTVTTISLGSHTLLDFYKPINGVESTGEQEDNSIEKRYLFSLLLEPKSLLVLQDEMYKTYLHGIRELSQDQIDDKSLILNFDHLDENLKKKFLEKDVVRLERQTRISLTIRYIAKILKLNTSNLLSKKK